MFNNETLEAEQAKWPEWSRECETGFAFWSVCRIELDAAERHAEPISLDHLTQRVVLYLG